LTNAEKQMIMLANLYSVMPVDVEQAIEKASLFLNGGRANSEEDDDGLRLYSFEKDADLIFAAFRQTHGIDLQKEKMHWWQFLALFMDLGQDTTFCQLIGLRKRVKTGKASKEEKETAQQMGSMFEIEDLDTRTIEEREKEAEFFRLIKR